MLPGRIEKTEALNSRYEQVLTLFHSWLLKRNCLPTLHFRLAPLWELFTNITFIRFPEGFSSFPKVKIQIPKENLPQGTGSLQGNQSIAHQTQQCHQGSDREMDDG